jgi:hypothetical protein
MCPKARLFKFYFVEVLIHLMILCNSILASLPPQAHSRTQNPKNLLAVIDGHCVVPVDTRHGVPCRYGTATCRRAVPDRAMGQGCGPWHDTWAVYPCRVAHGPRPFSLYRAGPWHANIKTSTKAITRNREAEIQILWKWLLSKGVVVQCFLIKNLSR